MIVEEVYGNEIGEGKELGKEVYTGNKCEGPDMGGMVNGIGEGRGGMVAFNGGMSEVKLVDGWTAIVKLATIEVGDCDEGIDGLSRAAMVSPGKMEGALGGESRRKNWETPALVGSMET
ncbi:hypothetical protein L1987_04412 [Smallanthus sonchifolius]|uniref:Uncharacterized protein n=1 Tax=Smallanthus sonchifolius TaxID=185202 RepID=A0ACB9KDI3_9ASTR|nr:hypothetical protein L1987_04412 [Smallanthus sonchifolius]